MVTDRAPISDRLEPALHRPPRRPVFGVASRGGAGRGGPGAGPGPKKLETRSDPQPTDPQPARGGGRSKPSGAKGRRTAEEWDRSPRGDWMLLPRHDCLLANPASAGPFDRKLRLYAVACC